MSWQQDLVTALKADATVQGKVSGRIYAHEAPRGAAYPLLVYTLRNERPVATRSATTTDDVMVQVDCVSDDYSDVIALKFDVINALEFKQFGKCKICRHRNTLEDFEPDSKYYRIILEFQIWQSRN
jgi:hypothetical protein